MSRPPMQLKALQKRILWFFGLISLIGFGAGYHFRNPYYMLLGLLGFGVVIGGVLRIVLDRRQLK